MTTRRTMPFSRKAASEICEILLADPADTFVPQLAARQVDLGVSRPSDTDIARLRHAMDVAIAETLSAAVAAAATPVWGPAAVRGRAQLRDAAIQCAEQAIGARTDWNMARYVQFEHDRRAAQRQRDDATETGRRQAGVYAAVLPCNLGSNASAIPALVAFAEQILDPAADRSMTTAEARSEVTNGLLVALWHLIAYDGDDPATVLAQACRAYDEEARWRLAEALRTSYASIPRIHALVTTMPSVISAVREDNDPLSEAGRLAGLAEELQRLLVPIVNR